MTVSQMLEDLAARIDELTFELDNIERADGVGIYASYRMEGLVNILRYVSKNLLLLAQGYSK